MSARTQTVIIGRGRDCDLLLTHNSISRRHAELILEPDGSCELRDLNSTGGTYVQRGGKEMPVTNTKLKSSDVLRLGDYEITLKDLLSLVPERPAAAARPAAQAADAGDGGGFKTRMMRCVCGSIKERGKPCPDCGA